MAKIDKTRKPQSGRRAFSFSGHAIPDRKPSDDTAQLEEFILDILSDWLANISGLSTEEGDISTDDDVLSIIYNYVYYTLIRKGSDGVVIWPAFPIVATVNEDGSITIGIELGSETTVGAVGITDKEGIDVSFEAGIANLSVDLLDDGGLTFEGSGGDAELKVEPCAFLHCCG